MHVTLELSGHPKANVKRVVIADRVVVGRSRECGLQIASAAVSRKHCEIRVGKDSVSVIDLGSSNGTFLDSTRLPAGEERPLPSGCRLNIGGVRFVVSYETAGKTSAPVAATPVVASETVPGDALPVETLAPGEELAEVGVSGELGARSAILDDDSPLLGDAGFVDDDPMLEDVEPSDAAALHEPAVVEMR
nr:FHA domain-containing protein [Planctomycetota bacterium]